MKFETIIQKLDLEGLKNAKVFFDFKNWEDNYIFHEADAKKDEIATGNKEYWWNKRPGHLRKVKSGECFDSMEECKKSALIHFLNNYS